MKHQVVIETPHSAVAMTTYLNAHFRYLFLDITYEPSSGSHSIADGAGSFTFTSATSKPPLPIGDPDRFKVIRQEYHRRSDINTVIKAASLQAACEEFFTSFEDTFEIVEERKPAPPRQIKYRNREMSPKAHI